MVTNIEVDRIEWHRIYVVTCPSCESTSGWRLWMKPRPPDEPAAGLECLACDLEWQHPLVYPAYIEARAARITAGTDGQWPPLELPPRDEDEDDEDRDEGIGWRPHSRTSFDYDESDGVSVEWWEPWTDGSSLQMDWPDLWEAEGIANGIDQFIATDTGVDLVDARRLWQDVPDTVATARAKLAELVGDRRNRAHVYHGSGGLLAQLRAVQARIDAKKDAASD